MYVALLIECNRLFWSPHPFDFVHLQEVCGLVDWVQLSLLIVPSVHLHLSPVGMWPCRSSATVYSDHPIRSFSSISRMYVALLIECNCLFWSSHPFYFIHLQEVRGLVNWVQTPLLIILSICLSPSPGCMWCCWLGADFISDPLVSFFCPSGYVIYSSWQPFMYVLHEASLILCIDVHFNSSSHFAFRLMPMLKSPIDVCVLG